MSTDPSKLRSLKSIKRQSIVVSQQSMVSSRPLAEGHRLLLVEPNVPGLHAVEWLTENRGWIESKLLEHGGIMLRGFDVPDSTTFERVARAISPELLDYVERAAPRKQVVGQVFTSTEYPADQWIPMHHEMSYSHNWPTKLFFYCDVEPTDRGYTPVADDRDFIRRLPEEIKAPFLTKGVMYVRNYGQGGDMPWWEVFQTRDREEVERYLRSTNTDFEWRGEHRLFTRMRRQVLATHPKTGDELWFNHAHMFHSSNMPREVRTALRQEFGEHEMPRNAFYGDGSQIPDEHAEAIRTMYRDAALCFPWRKGDVMVLDNFLTTHGRSPFSGPRRICVAMAELYTSPYLG